jgi:hypothetical protein
LVGEDVGGTIGVGVVVASVVILAVHWASGALRGRLKRLEGVLTVS